MISATRAIDGFRDDTLDPISLDDQAIRAAVGDDFRLSAASHRVQIRDDGRLLATGAAAVNAVAALRRVASARVSLADRPRVAERLAAAADHRVVGVHLALVRRNAEAHRHHVERARELIAGEESAARPLGPFVADVVWRAKTRLPVHRGAAAETRAGEDRHAEIVRRSEAAVEIQPARSGQLVLREIRGLVARSAFDDDDLEAARHEFARHDAAAGARSDYAHVAIDGRVGVVAHRANRAGAHHALRRRRVADARPGRVAARLVCRAVEEETRQPPQRLKSAPQERQAARRHRAKQPFPIRALQLRDSPRLADQERKDRTFEQSEQSFERRPVGGRQDADRFFRRGGDAKTRRAGDEQRRIIRALGSESRMKRVACRDERGTFAVGEHARRAGWGASRHRDKPFDGRPGTEAERSTSTLAIPTTLASLGDDRRAVSLSRRPSLLAEVGRSRPNVDGRPAAGDQRVEAPGTGAGEDEQQEDEAQQDRRLTHVADGKERSREMRLEVRDRHLAARDESDRPREQPDDEQDSPDRLDHAGDAEQRVEDERHRVRGRREVEDLLKPVLPEHQRSDDPQNAQRLRRPARCESGFSAGHSSRGRFDGRRIQERARCHTRARRKSSATLAQFTAVESTCCSSDRCRGTLARDRSRSR